MAKCVARSFFLIPLLPHRRLSQSQLSYPRRLSSFIHSNVEEAILLVGELSISWLVRHRLGAPTRQRTALGALDPHEVERLKISDESAPPGAQRPHVVVRPYPPGQKEGDQPKR